MAGVSVHVWYAKRRFLERQIAVFRFGRPSFLNIEVHMA